ncbi:YSC84-related protein [Allomuricauda sp. SCSIO 65647]|uniref:lipid-binding SYLF domain-containing protein n=1 Tax=Allomuricauda sp. SCSIO 65647 TaxID=2908843 RepID=UPI001F159743|nr:YSC84-related protein [Muricauda sp. SCSIO 65647]UJH66405.1 hypothetical protein L0P89_10540 [Muricauda sp. SCSIO 65647]
MKTSLYKRSKLVAQALFLLLSISINAQVKGWNPELESNALKAMDTLVKKMPKLESYKDEAHAYVVFPRITKAAATVGIALGNGVVYKDSEILGTARLKQANIGYQLGGQQYMEVIFFEDEEIFEKFKNGKLKLDAQASVVAFKKGASFDVAYQDGVAVFTATKGGLMYEASIGGQRFKYRAK